MSFPGQTWLFLKCHFISAMWSWWYQDIFVLDFSHHLSFILLIFFILNFDFSKFWVIFDRLTSESNKYPARVFEVFGVWQFLYIPRFRTILILLFLPGVFNISKTSRSKRFYMFHFRVPAIHFQIPHLYRYRLITAQLLIWMIGIRALRSQHIRPGLSFYQLIRHCLLLYRTICR